MSEYFPNLSFDERGICNLCVDWNLTGKFRFAQTRLALRNKLDEVVAACRGRGEYDAIVSYSGGKDSTYTLLLLKERYDLRLLALTIDNGFVAPAALENGRRITERLGIDWTIFRPNPQFMKTVYRNSIAASPYDLIVMTRSSEICASCIQIVNAVVLREAVRRSIPLIAGGYIGAQVPADMPVLKAKANLLDAFRTLAIKRLDRELHPQFSQYVRLSEEEKGKAGELPTIINPLLVEDYNEKEILRALAPLGWVPPPNTGKSSTNCLLNDFGIQKHLEKYRFHPYELEICQQVRLGYLTLEEAIERLEHKMTPEYYEDVQKKLDLS